MAIRRWRVWSVVLAAAILPAAFAHGADTPGGAPTAKDFETTEVKELPTTVLKVLKSLPTDPLEKDKKARDVIKDFEAAGLGVNSKSAEVRLNSAILIAAIQSLSDDLGLMEMLKNNDPAVKYYGAKGLGQISQVLKKSPNSIPRVISALATAAKSEKSSVVQQEIIKTLIIFEGADALVDVVDAIGVQMQTQAPDAGSLEITAQALEVIAAKASALSPANKTKLPGAAVNAASYAIQHYRVAEKMAKDEGKDVPADMKAATQKLINAAAKAISAGLGKAVNLGSSVDEAELNLNSTFGAPGGTGKVQGIQAPGVIKTGG